MYGHVLLEVVELFDGTGKEKTHIGYTKKIRFWDKMKAIELHGKSFGMFIDRREVVGKLTLADVLEDVFEGEAPHKSLPPKGEA